MTLNEIKHYITEYAKDYEEGRLSAVEYKDLLAGLEISNAITLNAEELQQKEELHSYIVGTITILSAV